MGFFQDSKENSLKGSTDDDDYDDDDDDDDNKTDVGF